jgi:transcriptional regulator with XRE-family HTH domain
VAYNRRFAEVFHDLRRTRGLTYRELAARTVDLDPRGKGLTHGYLASLAKGYETPTTRAIEVIANALDIEPQVFVEWRLAAVRKHFDEQAVGLERAATNLSDLANLLDRLSSSDRTQLHSDLSHLLL